MSTAKNNKRDKRIVALYRRGLGLAEIGERLGYTAEGVRGVLIRRGVRRRTAADRTRTRDDRIVQLYKSGLTCKAVGQKFGVTWSAVQGVLVRRGVPRRPPGFYPVSTPRSFLRARELVRKVAFLYDTGPGTSAVDLGRMTGLNHHTVRRHLVALGVKIRCGAGASTSVTAADVRTIKRELMRGTMTFQALADLFGISKSVIASIAMDRTWTRVPWPKGKSYVRRLHGKPLKLTEAIARRIKVDLERGVSFSEMAARYHVTTSTIFGIASGKAWARVPWPGGRGYPRRGVAWKIKLSPEKVREIKAHLCGDALTIEEIGEKYGVSEGAINHIAAGKTWKQIPWPTRRGYPGREPGQIPLARRKAGMVLETLGRRRDERRKGERAWEESRGRVWRK